jgi:signal transduction histidine kinase
MNRNKKNDKIGLSDELVRWLGAVLNAFDGWNWLTDEQAHILLCNQDARRITKDEKLPLLEGPKVSLDLSELVLSVAAEKKPVELAGIDMNFSGENKKQLANLRIIPLAISADELECFLVSLTQNEPSQELTSQTAENEKYKSLTGLAARIAHELNNPLDGSIRYIKLAQRRLSQNVEPKTTENSEKVTEYLSSAQEALGKINGILSDLVRFAKNGQSNLESIGINDMIEQAVRTLSARAGLVGVSIVTMLSENSPRTGGQKMYQVFCNLLKNAIDAIEEKRRQEPKLIGRIIIRTGVRDKTFMITVEDNGVGLPDDRQYLFDPFFTTKGPEAGTGLGLAISQEIVKQYHGRISAADGKNGGACFTVELPLDEESISENQEGPRP